MTNRTTSTGRQLQIVAPTGATDPKRTPRYDRFEMSETTHNVVKAAANKGFARLHNLIENDEAFNAIPFAQQLRVIELLAARAYGTVPTAPRIETPVAPPSDPASDTKKLALSNMLRDMASKVALPEMVKAARNMEASEADGE